MQLRKLHKADIYYEEFFINILRGGKVQWCWCVHFKEWVLRLLYYEVKFVQRLESQIKQLKILFYYSGFISFTRGLHFNWCKRWKNYGMV